MVQPERFEVLVVGSGTGGKLVAWHMAQSGRRTVVVERHWVGGSCPAVACMPNTQPPLDDPGGNRQAGERARAQHIPFLIVAGFVQRGSQADNYTILPHN